MSNERADVVPLRTTTMHAEVKRLAMLAPDDYECERKAAAARLKVRSSVLDKSVKAERARGGVESAPARRLPFADVEPWPEPVSAAEVLDYMLALVCRYVVAGETTLWAVVLWCALTWFQHVATVLPIALITSPEKNSGKSTLLEVIFRFARRALLASNISPAALFRCIEAWAPTLCLDECDSFAKDNEELRGILNSGHTRETAQVVRAVELNGDFEPRVFSTWAPKALAGIGRMPPTIESRSIKMPMRRKTPGEVVEQLRHADRAPFDEARRMLARWAQDDAHKFASSRPEVPHLSNRAADNWEPLLALAELAGGEWPERARKAARALTAGDGDAASINEELLTSVRTIFTERGVERLTTEALLDALANDVEAPWATWNNGRPMAARQLARRLSEFGIGSRTLWFPVGRDGKRQAKGYRLDDFADAFARYVSPTPRISVTPLQPSNDGPSSGSPSVTRPEAVTDAENPKALCHKACNGVTDKSPGEWEEEP